MKKPVVLLAWLSVPLAGAAGYAGARAGAPSGHPDGPSSKTGAVSAGKSSAAAGPVTKWATRLESSTAADLPAIFAEINAIKDPSARNTGLTLLCARWAEVDAPGGVAFFTGVKKDTGDSWGRIRLLTEWALRDVDGALEAAKALGNEADGEMTSVGRELLYDDPQRFWSWFEKVRRPFPSSESAAWMPVIEAHFEELAVIAAERIVEESKPGGPVIGTSAAAPLYKMLGASLAKKDGLKAIEWAKAIPGKMRNDALLGILGTLAAQQPEKAAEYCALVTGLQNGADRFFEREAGTILKNVVQTMAARDPLAALEWAVSNQGQPGAREAYMGMPGVFSNAMRDGKLTPEQAFNAVQALGKEADSFKPQMLRTMWGILTVEQLAAAATWLKGVEGKNVRQQAMAGVLEAWQQRDPAAAIAFAGQLNDPSLTRGLYQSMVRGANLGAGDTQCERVAAAISRVPAQQRAEVFYDQVHLDYGMPFQQMNSRFDGASFAATLADVPASEAKSRSMTLLAEVWGTSDPLSALEWAGKQTDAGEREKAAGAAVEAWAKQDAWGASEWIKEQPPGADRDTAAHHLARVMRNEEPQSAWAWAGDIQDPATRLEAQTAVLRKWRDSSATDAQAAVEALPETLTPAERQRLTDTLAGRDAKK